MRLIAAFILIVILFALFVFDFVVVMMFMRQAKSNSYHQTVGIITKCKQDPYSGDSGSGGSGGIILEYSYKVNGKCYTSEKIRNLLIATEPAEVTVKKYPVGTSLTVYYDPQKPENSILIPGLNGGDYSFLFIAVLFTVITAILLVHYFRKSH